MLTHPNFDPVLISLGPLAVRWYGLMYLVAFGSFWWLGTRRIQAGLAPITRAQLDDLLFGGIVGVILGGRLGYVLFYKPAYYFSHPLEIFAIWQGGMSFHGGFLGVLAAMAFVAYRQRVHWWDLMDFVAPLVPIGLAAGRLGNFINGELWGRTTDLPWGMVFRGAGDLPRHPSQLYQMALEGLALFALLWWFSSRPRPRMQVSALFLIGYGGFRFLGEFAREPDAFLGVLAFGMTMGQWLSLPMIAVGIFLWDAIVSAIVPVFGLVLCGWVAGRMGLVGAESSDALNQFVYYFALPAMLFAAVARGSLEQIFNLPFLTGVVLATLACAAAGFAVSAWFSGGSPQEHSLRALNASFSNTGYLGIPLVTVAYGAEAALPAAMATVATNVMLFAMGLTLLELFDRRHAGHGKGIALALLGTARSPLIWPIALAIALVAANLSLPGPLMRLADLLAGAAGPGALFALGLFVSRQSMRKGMPAAVPGVALKLLLHPLIAAAVFYGLVSVDPLWAKVAVVGASLPLGATAFVLAQRYKLLEVETSCSAVLSTALSVLTVSAVMALLAGR